MEDWDYKVKGFTLYRKNDFIKKIDLFNSSFHADRSRTSYCFRSTPSPFVHFYGWITDSRGYRILDTPELFVDVPPEFLSAHIGLSANASDGVYQDSFYYAYSNSGKSSGRDTSPFRKHFNGNKYSYGENVVDVDDEFLCLNPHFYNNFTIFVSGVNEVNSAYAIMKLNDTAMKTVIANTDSSLSSDLVYESWQKPVYGCSAYIYEEQEYNDYSDSYYTYEYKTVFPLTEEECLQTSSRLLGTCVINFEEEGIKRWIDAYDDIDDSGMYWRKKFSTVEECKTNSWIDTYERKIALPELNNGYDFFFADGGWKEKVYPGQYNVSFYEDGEKIGSSFIMNLLKRNENDNRCML